MFFDQTFSMQDLAVVGLLVLLEGVLSIDNALVLGLLARRVPKRMQAKALTYGLIGAFVFRIIAIATATYLLRWRIVKLLGGGYLVYIAVRHLFFESKQHEHEKMTIGPDGQPVLADAEGQPASDASANAHLRACAPIPGVASMAAAKENGFSARQFWSTVGVIELTDIAFAIDSILAAIALVGPGPKDQIHPKLWVVITGGMLGVILMRFAAVVFIKLLEKFPRFETSAYLLVAVIGAKLLVDWHFNTDPHHAAVNFHSPSNPAFWVFWSLMLACFLVGFIPRKGASSHKPA